MLIVPVGSAEICTHTYFRAVSDTFHHLQALFTPDVNICLGWSQLVRRDRLFTHMHHKCVFCDHCVLSSGRSLNVWLLQYNSLLCNAGEVHLKKWSILSPTYTVLQSNHKLMLIELCLSISGRDFSVTHSAVTPLIQLICSKTLIHSGTNQITVLISESLTR